MICIKNIKPIDLQCRMTCKFKSNHYTSLYAHWDLPLISESGVEADDVIGTLAAQAVGKGHDSISFNR